MRKAIIVGYSDGFRIDGKTISNLRYAEDIVLLATSPAKLQELVNRVESAARDYNMTTNAAKTKTMTNTDDELEIEVGAKRRHHAFVGANSVEQVNSFVYLSCRATTDADCANEIKSRLAIGISTMVKLVKV